MNINRILEREQYEDPAFRSRQEREVMREIAAVLAGKMPDPADDKRMTRHLVTGEINTYVIFWDGVRKGILYSGLELDPSPGNAAPVWLIFYVPENELAE